MPIRSSGGGGSGTTANSSIAGTKIIIIEIYISSSLSVFKYKYLN